jgi:hypothetical protein
MKFSGNILRNYFVLLPPSPRDAPIKAELRNLKRKAPQNPLPKISIKNYMSLRIVRHHWLGRGCGVGRGRGLGTRREGVKH